MSSRETIIVLDSELALHTGFQSALHDNHHVTKVRMSLSVHRARVSHTQYGARDGDAAMHQMINYYDPDLRCKHLHGQQCGVLLGKPVFLDNTLKPRVLIVESEPIPEGK